MISQTLARLAGLSLLFTAALAASPWQTPDLPSFSNVSVHDPSIVRDGSTFYVFGSHLASARTGDLMHWTQLSTDPSPGNLLVPDPQTEFAEALSWIGMTSFWAPDAIRLGDGRYYYYYCAGRLDSPRAALGLAVSDSITGPYKNVGLLLKSGMWGQPSPDGTIYDATKHPNTVDPAVFFDRTGRLWMVYGSYSGGIFILRLDPSTGVPLAGQGYGKKLIGGNHSRIEGPYILYSPETDYYYLFLSFGGLASDGGYNIRVGRSRSPDGPYYDAAGTDLTNVRGADGTLFDDASIAPHGVKLMGNYQFLHVEGEPGQVSRGYLSPGHNSAYYDPATHRYFLVFHTRFVGRGEEHEVRVHEMYLNRDGWPVVSPHRYAGGDSDDVEPRDLDGDYKLINHGKAISAAVNTSSLITLKPNRTVTGAATGYWQLSGRHDLTLTLDGQTYRGVFSREWDDDHGAWVYAFSALSSDGVAVWGSKTVISRTPPRTIPLRDRVAYYGETYTARTPEPNRDPRRVFGYSVVEGPARLTVDRATGVVSWRPTLAQVDRTFPVTILALDTSTNPVQTLYTFDVTVRSRTVLRRLDLDFSTPATGGLQDAAGQFTGLTARLPGTGGALPALDPNLWLDPARGVLELRSTQADFNGRAGLTANSSPGVALAGLGFTGTEDFSVTAVLRTMPALEFIDQVGLYVGASSDAVTRAGTIVFGAPERYSTHSLNGSDQDGHFFGFGFDGSDGMTVTLAREAGVWRYFVDGVEWNPLTPTAFLDGRADLVAGLFAITPLNGNAKTVEIDSLSVIVATHQSL